MNDDHQAKILQCFPTGSFHPLRCVLRVPQLRSYEDLIPGDGGDRDYDGGDGDDQYKAIDIFSLLLMWEIML